MSKRAHAAVKVHDHHDRSTKMARFNAALAVGITHGVGTMWCAYVFAVIALMSLPATIAIGTPVAIVAWIAQTFFQLVLLAIILVGQDVQTRASDARSEQEFNNTVAILDAMDVE